MIKSLLSLIVALGMMPSVAFANETLVYRIFNTERNETIGEQLVEVIYKDSGLLIESTYHDLAKPDLTRKTRSTLNADLETILFEVNDKIDNSQYTLRNSGNRLEIKGVFEGKPTDLTLKLNDLPYYHDPTVSLAKFALSGEKKLVFQVINPEDSKVYEMIATRKGEKKVTVGKNPVNAIEVHWTLNDFRSIFFSQTYWFRKSDGVFLTQEKPFENISSELVIQ